MVRPLDPSQFRIWHAVRQMPRRRFVIVVGAIIVPWLVVALHVSVSWLVGGRGGSMTRLVFMTTGLTVFFVSAFTWTWSHMERRYRATEGLRCPSCGQELGPTPSPRCPECGADHGVVTVSADEDQRSDRGPQIVRDVNEASVRM